MSVLDQLRAIEQQVEKRLRELAPLVAEFRDLEKVAERLGLRRDEPEAADTAAAKPSAAPKRKPKAKPKPSRSRTRTTGAAKPRASKRPATPRASTSAPCGRFNRRNVWVEPLGGRREKAQAEGDCGHTQRRRRCQQTEAEGDCGHPSRWETGAALAPQRRRAGSARTRRPAAGQRASRDHRRRARSRAERRRDRALRRRAPAADQATDHQGRHSVASDHRDAVDAANSDDEAVRADSRFFVDDSRITRAAVGAADDRFLTRR
jgi:hypothetical protein